MDDLDRLAFRLVRTIRTHHPQLRDRGFTLTDLEERLLPYREARREMADSGADAWERTVLRLVGGERGYVRAESELQSACRHALTLPSPTIALVRTWSGSSLTLGESATAVGSERVSGAFEAAQMAAPGEAASDRTSNGYAEPLTGPRTASHTASHTAPSSAPRLHAEAGGAPARTARGSACGCRYCGGRLPDGRTVTFCPHCGIDQTKRQCPACSTELDAAWRFCVTCGRSADLPDAPVEMKRAAS